MALHKLVNNFSGGEISPQLDARVDLQKYDTSCRKLENFRPLPWGGAGFRSGTLYIAATKTTAATRLLVFQFSTTVSYVIEIGNLYFRFYKDGARIETAPNVPYELTGGFLSSQVFEIQAREINDVVYLVHPNVPVQKLTRVTDTNWTLSFITWTYPALLDENVTATTLQVAATTGSGIAITASAATFTNLNAGSYYEIRHLRPSAKVELDISITGGTATSSNLKVKGGWTMVTTERWYGKLDIERSTDGGTVWTKVRTFASASDFNANDSGLEETDVLLRMVYAATGDPYATPPWVGTPPTTYVKARAVMAVGDVYIAGLGILATYISPTSGTFNILKPLESTAATSVWSESAWSDRRGYPRTLGFFEQRMLFAGTSQKPNTIWGSVTADFENFQFGDTDDMAFAYQFAATEQNPIQWLAPQTYINAGTSGGEFAVRSGNTDEPLTPSNVVVRGQSNYGSEFLAAIQIDSSIIFLQRQGKRIREVRERSQYVNTQENIGADLTLMAEHIMSAGIVQMDFARLPDPALFAVMGNGRLAVMTYNRDQNINAWSQYSTAGNFKSVACVYGTSSDVVYVIVERTIGGVTVQYVEVFTAPDQGLVAQNVYMDSAVAYDGVPTTTITGLSHLEGEMVAVLADGAVVGNAITGESVLTVTGGQITLPIASSTVRVGLPYIGVLKPMKLDLQMANGTSQGRKRRITELTIRFKDTLGGWVGNGNNQLPQFGQFAQEIPFRSTENGMDSAPPLFTGDIPVDWAIGPDGSGDIWISQQQPLPMTVLGLFAKTDFFGD